jgi:hypothetical protein
MTRSKDGLAPATDEPPKQAALWRTHAKLPDGRAAQRVGAAHQQ